MPDPGANAGGTVGGCPNACRIVSETEQTSPGDRSRKRIGVGERVLLRVEPAQSATWSVTQGATLTSTSGASVTLVAGDVGVSATVTATSGGCSCSETFTVVAPSTVSIVRDPARGYFHRQGKPSSGFVGIVHIGPDDVNFDAIEYREEDVQAVGGGSLQGWNFGGHHPNADPLPVSENVVAGHGSRSGIDVITVQINATGNLAPGTVTWSIPWLYRVNGGTEHSLATIDQVANMDANGSVTIRKAGGSASRDRSHPSSNLDTMPPIVEDAE